jgi:hypothetical protein
MDSEDIIKSATLKKEIKIRKNKSLKQNYEEIK